MSGAATFDAGWLALREPFDRAARAAAGFPDAVAVALGPAVRVVGLDLGGGTGSLLRCLLPRLGEDQAWRLVDADASLLDAAPASFAAWAEAEGHHCRSTEEGIVLAGAGWSARVEPCRADLSAGLSADRLATARGPVNLVAASALLDLVSADWVERFVQRCRAHGAVLACSLNYDGRIEWTPTLPFDARATRAINRDQVRDKGFGVALGPSAADALRAALARAGMQAWCAPTDWIAGTADTAMQRRLLDDLTRLAQVLDDPAEASDWRAERAALIAAGASRLRVGHADIIGRP